MWKDKSYAKRQFAIFNEVLGELDKAGFSGYIKHIANSAAITGLPEMHLDMVRAGTVLMDARRSKQRRPGAPGDLVDEKPGSSTCGKLPPDTELGTADLCRFAETRVAVLPSGLPTDSRSNRCFKLPDYMN